MRNTIKTVFLIFAFPAFFYLFVLFIIFIGSMIFNNSSTTTTLLEALGESAYLAYPPTKPVLIAMGVSLPIAYFFGGDMMHKAAGAKRLRPVDATCKELLRSVENIALVAGVPTPKVYVSDDEGLNAYATGRSPKKSSIGLTTGIIQALNKKELEGVIAHEMAHIKNRDVLLDTLIVAGIGSVTLLAGMLFSTALAIEAITEPGPNSKEDRSGGAYMMMIACLIGAAILSVYAFAIAPFIRFAISRTREYQADATAVLFTRDAQSFASALDKVSDDSYVPRLSKQRTMAAACIASPFSGSSIIDDLFSTHPPMEERIRRLGTPVYGRPFAETEDFQAQPADRGTAFQPDFGATSFTGDARTEEGATRPVNAPHGVPEPLPEEYGSFVTGKKCVPMELLGTWNRSKSGRSITLTLSPDRMRLTYPDGRALEISILGVAAKDNAENTKNEFPRGWTITGINAKVVGGLPMKVGAQTSLLLYLSADNDRVLQCGSGTDKAFTKTGKRPDS